MQVQGLGGMGGGNVRSPGKSGLTLDNIISWYRCRVNCGRVGDRRGAA
jgi:hypothetical protein